MIARRAMAVVVGAMVTLLAVAPGTAQQGVAGTYCLVGVREVGSCFRLGADQRFEYFLSYGAYDESSEGRWRIDGTDVVLDSPPYDRRPQFAFKERRPAAGEAFEVVVVTGQGRGIAGIDVRVTCDGHLHEGYTQQDGLRTPCTTAPSEIALGIRMVALAHQVVPVPAAGTGKALVFSFEPGDLGKKAFAATRLRREHEGLSLTYRNPALGDLDGRPFTYRRA